MDEETRAHVFELFFKPADDKGGYYEFQVNAAGTVLDMRKLLISPARSLRRPRQPW